MSGRCELQPWPAFPERGFDLSTSLVPYLVRFGFVDGLSSHAGWCQTRPLGSPYSDDCDGHLWLDNGGACSNGRRGPDRVD